MKKITLTLICGLMAVFTFAQDRKGQVRLKPGVEAHRLYVSFKTDIAAADNAVITSVLPEFGELITGYGIVAKKGVSLSETKLDEMEQQARRLTGSSASVSKLRNIVELTIENPTNERLLSLAIVLEKHEAVEYCSLTAATPVAPPGDIFPNTPLAEAEQLYIEEEIGVNMRYAWDLGLTGEGINIRDIEYGFNSEHEEFNEVNAEIGGDMAISDEVSFDFSEHGTAVFGIVYSDKGTYGISGMAYGANELLLFPEWQPNNMGGYNRIAAIEQCIENSDAGDVVMYEMQMPGPTENYCPAEYDQVVWDLTKAASDTGIVIVAAAGNGGDNLDSFLYNSYMNRGNSGAIIVGAGSDDGLRDRLSFSTYGERVDLQGWGQGVYTTGYGDIQISSDVNQYYTESFNGTSSATPIVASCAAVLQGQYHDLTGGYLTGPELRDVLVSTGKAQGLSLNGHIGPLPDMEAATAAVAALASTNDFASLRFVAYPNPVENVLTIKGVERNLEIKISNILGQEVYSSVLTPAKAQIDFSDYSAGVYNVRIIDGNKTYSQKIVKR